jgi:hypothetical protein
VTRGLSPAARRIPWGIVLFLVYAFLILAGIGFSLRFVVEQAINAPVSFIGVVVMALLAYTIFTITLVLQRKAAARGFALGLTSLVVPPIAVMVLGGHLPIAIFLAALGGLLYLGLRDPGVSRWLDQA